MKTKTILLLLLAASLALGASGCGLIKGVLGGAAEEAGLGDLADAVLGADEDPTPAAEEEPESPTAPPAEATAEPAPEGEEDQGIGELSPMEALDSYRSEFSQTATVDGTVTESWTMTQEYTRDPQARHTISNSSEGGLFEVVQFPDVSYMNADGEWMSFSSDEDMTSFFPQPTGVEPDDLHACVASGAETVNGFSATHYVCDIDESLAAWMALADGDAEYQAETWVSEEYGVVVRTLIRTSITDEDGKVTETVYETNVTSINEPMVIEPPEGVAPPGVAEDIPVMEGAVETMSFMGMTTYEVTGQTPETAAEWYREQMAAGGWTLDENQSSDEAMVYTKDGRTVTIMIGPDADGVTITIMSGEQ